MILFINGLLKQLPDMEILQVCGIIVVVTFSIITNLFISHKRLDRFIAGKTGLPEQEVRVYVERFFDFFFWAFIPVILVLLLPGRDFASIGLALPTGNWGWWVIGGAGSTLIILVIRFLWVKPTTLYPEVHEKDWYPKRFIRYCSSWVVSLVGYEVLYRGILFLALYRAFGFLPALIIQSCFYGLAHFKRGALESFNSTYFSAYLCITVFYSGSLIPAYLTHLSIAVMNAFFEIQKNPDMHFIPRKTETST